MIKNHTWTFVLTLILISGWLCAQQLTPYVVSASGGFYSTDQGMLSFTTGELAATETYAHPNFILTQGFQQPWDFGTSIEEQTGAGFSFRLYPNPTDGIMWLTTESKEPVTMVLRIVDLLGREMLRLSMERHQEINTQMLDMTRLPAGMYILSYTIRFIHSENHFVSVHPVTLVK